jgi:hypothetical protein
MNWTKTPPTVPGVYWLFEPGQPPELVQVADHYGALNVWGFGWRDYDHVEHYRHAHWMGPIEAPPPPPL